MHAESLPDVTGFFSTLQSPVTPLLPSFWAGELMFASLKGGWDFVHAGALWSTALAFCVGLRAADERWHFSGYSRSQEAPKARFTKFHTLDALARVLPLSPVRKQLLVKDTSANSSVPVQDVDQPVHHRDQPLQEPFERQVPLAVPVRVRDQHHPHWAVRARTGSPCRVQVVTSGLPRQCRHLRFLQFLIRKERCKATSNPGISCARAGLGPSAGALSAR